MILDYFGEDTSALAPRLNCCDNCLRDLNKQSAQRGCSVNQNASSSNASAPILHNFIPNDAALVNVLSRVRDNIALTNNISPVEFIASSAALEKMVTMKPTNLDELRHARLDGFTMEKINRFGSTFVNAIAKYLVSKLKNMFFAKILEFIHFYRKVNWKCRAS